MKSYFKQERTEKRSSISVLFSNNFAHFDRVSEKKKLVELNQIFAKMESSLPGKSVFTAVLI